MVKSREASEIAASLWSRRSCMRVDIVEKRVERAEALISTGEISARHALEGSPVALGNEDILNAVKDEDKTPSRAT